MELNVREQRLPGVGVRFEIDLADGRTLVVVAGKDGRRELCVRDADDDVGWELVVDAERSVILASLLLGARFTLDTSGDRDVAADEVAVDAAVLGEASPAIGATRSEISLPDPEAVVLAVVSDSTPDLVEDERVHRCLPGDRVVVAARAAGLDELLAHLAGPDPTGG